MSSIDRVSVLVALLFIITGLLFLIMNLIPGADFSRFWPIVFFIIAAGFLLPHFLWPQERKVLAAFFIPAFVLIALGLIFLYNVRSSDWTSWAYVWILIPASVGAGLALAAKAGDWGKAAATVGTVMFMIGIILFGLFGVIFGSTAIKLFIAVLLILCGTIMLISYGRKSVKNTKTE